MIGGAGNFQKAVLVGFREGSSRLAGDCLGRKKDDATRFAQTSIIFFPTHSPASQEEPDPCIQALLSESSLLLCSWHAKEKGHY